jgi:hypothetical protein
MVGAFTEVVPFTIEAENVPEDRVMFPPGSTTIEPPFMIVRPPAPIDDDSNDRADARALI